MVLYTPPLSCSMASTSLPSLPPLSHDLLASWSLWRQSKHSPDYITPPMSNTLLRLKAASSDTDPVTALPPITYFDRQLSAMSPLTPPRSTSWRKPKPLAVPSQPARPPPDAVQLVEEVDEPVADKPAVPDDAPHLVNFFDPSMKRSAHFIAEKTCEMICYLWFSSSISRNSSIQPPSPPYSPENVPATNPLQLIASPTFIQFMQKVLETTQVSQSVIVLSLHYIYRLKERNRFTAGQPGSEFRIAVAALMMANKFLDDNTYTNKTWSEVSGISLTDVNRMEREFLVGIDFGLYVDNQTYASWLNLLKGLVMAKERDSRQWRKSRASRRLQYPTNVAMSARPARIYTRHQLSSHRARSTSPTESRSFTYPSVCYPSSYVSPAKADHSPLKRTATDAFSPTSASFSQLPPLKRPTGMTLQIPTHSYAGPSSGSPLESLGSFSKMSLSSPHLSRRQPTRMVNTSHDVPSTLAAAYRADRPMVQPQHLYYYTLTGSSVDGSDADPIRSRRKTSLRCYQPPPVTTASSHLAPSYMPVDIQSASVSPHEVHASEPHVSLPHLHDAIWFRDVPTTSSRVYHHGSPERLPPIRDTVIPSAPFANAGPPGVHFHAYPRSNLWSSNRR